MLQKVLHAHVLNLLTRRLAQAELPGTLLPDSALAFLHPLLLEPHREGVANARQVLQ
jgi:hypothetical protein